MCDSKRSLIPTRPSNYFIKYVSWNVNPLTFNHPWDHPISSLPVIIQRYKGAEQSHPCQKCPWIFQKLADVNRSRLAPIKRGVLYETSKPSTRPGSLRRLPTFLQRKTPPVCVSAPCSVLGLSSSLPPAAAPTCGSLVQRTPHWRRARWISPWRPNRRKTWWEFLWESWVWNASAGWMAGVGALCNCWYSLRIVLESDSHKLVMMGSYSLSCWALNLKWMNGQI